jgi:hypothetical protein
MIAGSRAIMNATRYRKNWKQKSESSAVVFSAIQIEIIYCAKAFPETAPALKASTKAIISPVLNHIAMKGGRA